MTTLELLLTHVNFTIVTIAFILLCGVALITSAILRATVRENAYRHQERMEDLRQTALGKNLLEHRG